MYNVKILKQIFVSDVLIDACYVQFGPFLAVVFV